MYLSVAGVGKVETLVVLKLLLLGAVLLDSVSLDTNFGTGGLSLTFRGGTSLNMVQGGGLV